MTNQTPYQENILLNRVLSINSQNVKTPNQLINFNYKKNHFNKEVIDSTSLLKSLTWKNKKTSKKLEFIYFNSKSILCKKTPISKSKTFNDRKIKINIDPVIRNRSLIIKNTLAGKFNLYYSHN